MQVAIKVKQPGVNDSKENALSVLHEMVSRHTTAIEWISQFLLLAAAQQKPVSAELTASSGELEALLEEMKKSEKYLLSLNDKNLTVEDIDVLVQRLHKELYELKGFTQIRQRQIAPAHRNRRLRR